jgi:NADH-quinone oxidoreductase subunit A
VASHLGCPGTQVSLGVAAGTLRAVSGYLGGYATLGLLLIAGVAFFVVAFTANRLLRPRRSADTPGKYETYECGLDPVGGDWAQAQIRYYVYAYLYALFAVESVFLFPWAVVYDRPEFGMSAVVEMAIFVGVLALGLLYAWRKRVLRWT